MDSPPPTGTRQSGDACLPHKECHGYLTKLIKLHLGEKQWNLVQLGAKIVPDATFHLQKVPPAWFKESTPRRSARTDISVFGVELLKNHFAFP